MECGFWILIQLQQEEGCFTACQIKRKISLWQYIVVEYNEEKGKLIKASNLKKKQMPKYNTK
jgi:hypothetical protein